MRPIALGGVAATAIQLFFPALVLVAIRCHARLTCVAKHYIAAKCGQQCTPCHAHQLLQCGSNTIIDSLADSELWTFQEPWAMSWQHKRRGTVLSQNLTDH